MSSPKIPNRFSAQILSRMVCSLELSTGLTYLSHIIREYSRSYPSTSSIRKNYESSISSESQILLNPSQVFPSRSLCVRDITNELKNVANVFVENGRQIQSEAIIFIEGLKLFHQKSAVIREENENYFGCLVVGGDLHKKGPISSAVVITNYEETSESSQCILNEINSIEILCKTVIDMEECADIEFSDIIVAEFAEPLQIGGWTSEEFEFIIPTKTVVNTERYEPINSTNQTIKEFSQFRFGKHKIIK